MMNQELCSNAHPHNQQMAVPPSLDTQSVTSSETNEQLNMIPNVYTCR